MGGWPGGRVGLRAAVTRRLPPNLLGHPAPPPPAAGAQLQLQARFPKVFGKGFGQGNQAAPMVPPKAPKAKANGLPKKGFGKGVGPLPPVIVKKAAPKAAKAKYQYKAKAAMAKVPAKAKAKAGG